MLLLVFVYLWEHRYLFSFFLSTFDCLYWVSFFFLRISLRFLPFRAPPPDNFIGLFIFPPIVSFGRFLNDEIFFSLSIVLKKIISPFSPFHPIPLLSTAQRPMQFKKESIYFFFIKKFPINGIRRNHTPSSHSNRTPRHSFPDTPHSSLTTWISSVYSSSIFYSFPTIWSRRPPPTPSWTLAWEEHLLRRGTADESLKIAIRLLSSITLSGSIYFLISAFVLHLLCFKHGTTTFHFNNIILS